MGNDTPANSKMFAWTKNDLVRSVTTSLFVAIIAVLYGITAQANFDVFTADWGLILHTVINSVFITFIGRMGEKFVTDQNGKVFGHIG